MPVGRAFAVTGGTETEARIRREGQVQPGAGRVGMGRGALTEARTWVSVFPAQRGACRPPGGDSGWDRGLGSLGKVRRTLGICLLVHKKEGVPKVQAFLSCLGQVFSLCQLLFSYIY